VAGAIVVVAIVEEVVVGFVDSTHVVVDSPSGTVVSTVVVGTVSTFVVLEEDVVVSASVVEVGSVGYPSGV
jgi:hypothetical protein